MSAKGKGKETKSGDNTSGAEKKAEAKPGFVEATQAPPPPIIKPPIMLRSATWENHSQSAETPPNETSVDVSAGGHIEAANTSTSSSPGGAVSIPPENEPVSAARVAFGLRLTTALPETSTATRSSTPEPQSGQVVDVKLANPARQNGEADRQSPQIPAVPIIADANRGASSGSRPANSDGELLVRASALPSDPRDGALRKVPDTPMLSGSGDDRLDDGTSPSLASEPSSAGGFETAPAASRPVAASSEYAGKQDAPGAGRPVVSGQVEGSSEYAVKQSASNRTASAAERPLQMPDGDSKPVPDLDASSAPVSLLSRSLTDSQAANLQTVDLQNLLADTGKQPAPWNSSLNAPVDARIATPVDSPAQQRAVPLDLHQEQEPVEKSSNTGPAPNAKASETGVTPDHSDSSHNESRESANTGPPAQASGGSDTRAGRSAADPLRPTPSRAMQSPLTPSQGTTSQTSSFQTPPIQAAASAASASEAPKGANEPEINTAPQAQPARQISLKLTGDDSSKVTVDLSERAGKVQVSVRTADPELAKSLRGDLGDLVGRLENKGFKTEAWLPTASRHTPAAAPEQPGSSNSQRDRRHSGSGADQRQGRQGQNRSNQRQPARWMAQLEETISTIEETGTKTE